jgi:mRNA-degrading endonuclease toxin of MazEF toxin-antitoxin module
LLIQFPFSGAGGQKERPAIVISTDSYHEEWDELLVVAVTSRRPKSLRPTDYFLQDWNAAGLRQPSWTRSHVATLHRMLILRQLGTLSKNDLDELDRRLRFAAGL